MAMNMSALLNITANVKGREQIERLGNSLQGVQGKAKNLAASFTSLRGGLAAIGGSVAVAGFSAIVKKAVDAGDALYNMQQQTGIAAKELTGIANAAKLADVDTGTLIKGMTKLNVALVNAAAGNKDAAAKFAALGISVKGADGQLLTADKALKQVADRFADMPDGAGKAAAAVALFGKAGVALIPLLNEGAAAMDEFTYKISDDFAARSDQFNDTLAILGIKAQGFGLELTDALLPALQSILEVFSELFNTKQDWTALFDVIKVGIRVVASVLLAMVKLVDEAARQIVTFAQVVTRTMRGDFAGAFEAGQQFVGGFTQRFQTSMGQFQRIWTDAASPGTGMRPGGRGYEAPDQSGAAAAAAREAERARREAERAAEQAAKDYNTALERSVEIAADLRYKIRDLGLQTQDLGAVGLDAIGNKYQGALNDIEKSQAEIFQQIQDLVDLSGGQLKFEGLQQLAKDYLNARSAMASAERDAAVQNLARQETGVMTGLMKESGTLTNDPLRQLEINERLLEIQREFPDLYARQADEIRRLVELSAGLTEQQQKIKDAVMQAGEAVQSSLANAMSSAVTAVVTGVGSIKQSLGDMFKSIGQAFVQMAAQIIAKMLVMAAVGAILKALGVPMPGGGGGFSMDSTPLGAGGGSVGGIGTLGPNFGLPARANGGPVAARRPVLVGERGPEVLVPGSSGNVMNNDKLREAMGASPTQRAAAPMLSMTFETTNIGGTEYVSRDQLEAAMRETRRAASRDGAKRGMSMTLDRLQQSPSTRTRVGLR